MIAGTALPPWALPGAVADQAWRRRPLVPSTVAVLGDLSAEDRERLLTGCWAAVLARCTGEPEVTVGVLCSDGRHRLVTGPATADSWSALLDELADDPRSVCSEGVPPTSAVSLHPPPARSALSIRLDADALEISHDTSQVSGATAERLLGYLGYALDQATRSRTAAVDLTEMLDEQERHHQLTALCGPRVANGPDTFVTGWRSRVAERPAAPAVRHRAATLTYAELDVRSERLANRLRACGLTPGAVVAVVSERHLDWAAAVLAVFKAGAVYLPVRPDFPAGRVTEQLIRAGCRHALTDPPGAVRMAEALAGGEKAWFGTVLPLSPEPPADQSDDPAAQRVRAASIGDWPAGAELSAPAYVYFTSGSTGRPKGAVCSHDGLINHLWAKVDDHGLGPDTVLTQTASQCFDISLWQLCAPLLVGGETVIVDTDAQLDVGGFLDLLARHHVTTIQIVPSYLEILLAHVEAAGGVGSDHPLAALTSVSVTGEPLKARLVQRWFAVLPRVRLVNAYGTTEVSDDTMHAVLDRPPERDLAVVSVGRPLRNVNVYVLDDLLGLLPEGARGEIVFAGVCVGQGYLNDPDLTAERFVEDPFRPGERLYRSGDLGRWLPEGRLEFLGRRDDQVKLRGLRIELGEIEAALSHVPGVAAAAAVVVGEGNGARLVAFYTSEEELVPLDLHDLLSARLPPYMVPSHRVRLPALPLNDNGKVDKRQLVDLAGDLGNRDAFAPPGTETERELATLWAEVLGLPAGRVGRNDDFFDLGGTSLSAIHLLMRLKHRLSLVDLAATPVLAAQAELLAGPKTTGDEAEGLLLDLGPLPSEPVPGEPDRRPTLVCLPDAGGNAINFQQLAEALAGQARVLGVEPPGHDLARPDESPAELAVLARRVADQFTARLEPGTPVHVYGQGAGAAAALATAAALQAAGCPVAGVVTVHDAASTPDPDRPLTDATVADLLRRRSGYVEVDGGSPDRLAFVARVFRHDWEQARRASTEGVSEEVGAGGGWSLTEILLGGATSGPAGDRTARRMHPDLSGDLSRLRPDLIGAALSDRAAV